MSGGRGEVRGRCRSGPRAAFGQRGRRWGASLLRYFYLKGLTNRPLVLSALLVEDARDRTATLPRTLESGVTGVLLASCDPGTVVGVRDFAVCATPTCTVTCWDSLSRGR